MTRPSSPYQAAKPELPPALPDNFDVAPFQGLISKCFEPYLYIYIESQDSALTDLVDRAAVEQRERGVTNLAVEGSSVLHRYCNPKVFFIFIFRSQSVVRTQLKAQLCC